ncbi:MAG: hypothetical protein ACLVIY_07625 [Anaerobutyricum soehngenii]
MESTLYLTKEKTLIQSDISGRDIHKEEKKQLLGCCEPAKGTEEGSDTITVFWRLFAEGDCGDA